jgi:hypothetical protein
VERCPHRDQRMILRYSHRVLSLLLSFLPLFFPHLSVSCMGRERSSGCCVILRSRFIGATHNFVPPPLFYTGRRHPPTSFISHSLHTPQSLDLISRLRFPIITTPSLCVRPLLLSLLSYVHITFLPLIPFVVYIFYPTFPFSSVYILP